MEGQEELHSKKRKPCEDVRKKSFKSALLEEANEEKEKQVLQVRQDGEEEDIKEPEEIEEEEEYQEVFDLPSERLESCERLRSAFQSIFDKYERHFDGESDEIDLRTGRIVVDNGFVRGTPTKIFGKTFFGGDEGEGEEEEVEDEEDGEEDQDEDLNEDESGQITLMAFPKPEPYDNLKQQALNKRKLNDNNVINRVSHKQTTALYSKSLMWNRPRAPKSGEVYDSEDAFDNLLNEEPSKLILVDPSPRKRIKSEPKPSLPSSPLSSSFPSEVVSPMTQGKRSPEPSSINDSSQLDSVESTISSTCNITSNVQNQSDSYTPLPTKHETSFESKNKLNLVQPPRIKTNTSTNQGKDLVTIEIQNHSISSPSIGKSDTPFETKKEVHFSQTPISKTKLLAKHNENDAIETQKSPKRNLLPTKHDISIESKNRPHSFQTPISNTNLSSKQHNLMTPMTKPDYSSESKGSNSTEKSKSLSYSLKQREFLKRIQKRMSDELSSPISNILSSQLLHHPSISTSPSPSRSRSNYGNSLENDTFINISRTPLKGVEIDITVPRSNPVKHDLTQHNPNIIGKEQEKGNVYLNDFFLSIFY